MVHIRLIAVGDRCQWLSVTRAQYLEDTAITGGMGLPGNQMLLRRDRVDDLGQECERMATTAMRLIGDVAGDRPPNGWHPLHVELAGLEARATGEANATRKPERQRSLDHLAGALISLRTALLVGARLRDDITTPTVLRDAADDIVTVRCEDLVMSARELGGPSG